MGLNCLLRLCFTVLILTSQTYSYAQTFNGAAPLPFPPSGTTGQTSSIASVSGIGILGGCKQIEKVTIDLNHQWDGDIALFLICPDGTFLELSSGNGGPADDYKITVFKDNAPSNVITGSPPFNGDFQAEGRQNVSLFNPYSNAGAPGTYTLQNTFNGKNADGDWTLFLNDFVAGDIGTLNAWSITFTNGTSFTLDLNGANPACPGNTVNVIATTNPSGNYTYNWASNNGTPFTGQSTNTINSTPTSTTTYTVTVTDPSGSCTATDEIIINVPNVPNPGTVDVSALPSDICIGKFTTLSFTNTVSNAWLYNVTATTASGSSNFSVNVNGTSGTITLSPASTTTYTVTSITDVATGCTFILPNPVSTVVNVTTILPTFSALSIPPICAGTTIDLNDYIILINGTTATFHSASPANASNEINSTVTPLVNTIYTILFANGSCTTEINTLITVISSSNNPIFNSASVCTNQSLNLTSLINPATSGQFSGPNVSGNNFSSSISGSFVVTFTPTSSCLSAIDATITVSPIVTPSLLSTSFCYSATPSINLTSLQDPLYATGTWTGTGVAGNTFTPPTWGNYTLTFTSNQSCVLPATTQIIVTEPTVGILTPLPDYCQNQPPINLTTLVTNGVAGNWSGAGVSGNIFDPGSVTGAVLLAFTPNALCNTVSTITFNVIQNQLPNMAGTDVCNTNTSFNLTALEDPAFAGGVWSGAGVTGNNFNASLLSGQVVLTFQSNAQCVLPIDVTMSIQIPETPVLKNESWCEAQGLFDLDNLLDPNFTTGTWSGSGVIGNNFDPANLSGIVSLTFTSSIICVNPANTFILVEAGQSPSLSTATLCNTGPVFNLSTLEDPNYPNGDWSGQGVSNNTFNPANLFGSINITYQALGCTFPVTTTIGVNTPIEPTLGSTSICENGTPIDLVILADPNYPVGAWSGLGVTNGLFNPSGLQGNIPVIFTSSSNCTLPAETSVEVNTVPAVTNVSIDCQSDKNNYTVSFDISGGNSMTYTINGLPTGNFFTSQLIASGTTYSFAISDANNCAPVLLQGSKNCACTTNAGTMNISSTNNKVCKDNIFTATHNGDQVLDNDNFIFVLHDNAGPSLGNILATNTVPSFGFPVGGQLNTKYYISAVAANANGQFIDLNDPCLSVSSGAPLEFYEIQATLSGQSSTCIDKDFSFEATLNGIPPFTIFLSYTNAGITIKDTIYSPTNTVNVIVNPKNLGLKYGSCAISIDQIKDANCLRKDLASNIFLFINGLRNSYINSSLCKGEYLVVNGTTYNENKKSGIETIASNDPAYCDSTIAVNLSFKAPVTKNFNTVACKGKSFNINGKIYDETNPTGIEVFKAGAANGCDSIVPIAIVFNDKLTTGIDTSICIGNSIVINGVSYNETKLFGSTILQSKAGCDSVVNVKVVVNDLIKKSISPTICEGEKITIGGKVFSATNALDSVIINSTSSINCDTLVKVSLGFFKKSVNNFTQDICENESITLNGTLYNKTKLTGIETIVNGAKSGCDSTIFIKLNILPIASSNLDTTLCNEDSLIINGKRFDRKNPSGTLVLTKASVQGCDSTINVMVNFYPLRVDTIRKKILPSDSFKIENFVFDINKPNGRIELSMPSSTGCDSIAYVILSFINTTFNLVDINQKDEVCLDSENGSIVVNEIRGCDTYTLKIDGVVYAIDKLPFIVEPLKPGSYEIELTSLEGCYYKDTVVVKAANAPQPYELSSNTIDVIKGENQQLDLKVSPQPSKIQWVPDTYLSCDDCLDVTFLNPVDSQEYQLLLSDSNGCTQNVVFKLNANNVKRDIVFPNIINLNSNNENSVWTILSTSDYNLSRISIYDRWGSKVFIAGPEDGKIIWDANINGKALSPGVYVYYAEAITGSGKIKHYIGDVTVIK